MVQKLGMQNLTGDSLTVGNTVITGTGVTVSGEPLSGGTGGAEVYANASVFPLTNLTAGSFAFANNNNTLFMSNGSGWYKIALINQTPSVNASIETATLGNSGNTVLFTYSIVEPEGTPTTVTISNSGISNTSVANIVHYTSNNTIEFNNFSGDEYSANLVLTVSDGINLGTDSVTITVQFINQYWVKRNISGGINWHFDENYNAYYQITGSESDFSAGADTNNNLHMITKIGGADSEYDWTTYLQADMNNYNSSHSGVRMTSANGAPIAIMENPEVIGGQGRYSPMFFRLNPTTGAVEKGLSIPYGFYSPKSWAGAGQSSVDSGSIWWVGSNGSDTNTIGVARIPWSMYTSGDTINTGNNHFYTATAVDTGWYDGGAGVNQFCADELDNGNILASGYSYRSSGAPNYNLGYYSYLAKFDNTGTLAAVLTSNPTISYTTATNGFFPQFLKANKNNKVLLCGRDSYSTYTNRLQMCLVDASNSATNGLSSVTQTAYSVSGYTSSSGNWQALNVHIDESNNFIVWMYSAYWDRVVVAKFDDTDLSQVGDAYMWSGITSSPTAVDISTPIETKVTGLQNTISNYGAWIEASGSLPFTKANEIFGSTGTIATLTTGSESIGFSTAGTPSWTRNTFTPTDIYGNHPTTYGGDANYFNVITTNYDQSSYSTYTSNSDFTQL